jgi:D-alanyl-D-alanine carboxypeptidase
MGELGRSTGGGFRVIGWARGAFPAAAGMLVALVLAAALALRPDSAKAQIGSDRYSSIVIDAASGRVLEAVNPDEQRFPASLTKIMTAYMLFEALHDGRVKLDQPVPVSAHAASMAPSKLGLAPGSQITVEEALLGMVTKSANDAAAAVGELLGGSEDQFAQMMTVRARALGMTATTFRNASGLPDPEQVTTARDMAVLARHLVQDFPTEYRYFSTPGFEFHGRMIPNHDHMLTTYPGADGIKTGYTIAAGHNLATSAIRDGVRLIGIVLGASSNFQRDVHMAALLDQGFLAMNVAPPGRHGPPVQVAAIPSLVSSAQAATVTTRIEPAARVMATIRPAIALERWGVRLGSFGSMGAAEHVAERVRRETIGGEVEVVPVVMRNRPIWRAELLGLTQAEAVSACGALAHRGFACTPFRLLPGHFASR